MVCVEDIYGEVFWEFQSIVQEMEYFGIDYCNVICQQVFLIFLDEFLQFLMDMFFIVNFGGDMQGFFDDKKDKYF